MAKDYFQDIVPPEEEAPKPVKRTASKPAKIPVTAIKEESISSQPVETTDESDDTLDSPQVPAERSIRNIDVPERSPRVSRPSVDGGGRGPRPLGAPALPPKPRRPRSKAWLWVCAALLIVILAGLALFFFRKTTVTVTPRSHTIVFDQTSDFTAYPSSSGTSTATGLLTYTTVASDLQESQVIPASGTQHVENKAQGSITVYNDFSTSPVKLIKNTRFASPTGLIFRVPDDIVVPGKIGSTPGHISVIVFADQAGDQYNIGPTARFTVPGLQSDPAMYANVYAQSTASTTGGFIGDQPAADPTAVANAQSALRIKLAQEAKSAASASNNASTIVLPDLIQITYQDLPQTTEAGGGARINESAHLVVPVFDSGVFTQTIAQSVAADAQGQNLSFIPGKDFMAQYAGGASSTVGADEITFSLSGNAMIVWQVDQNALKSALLGKNQSAFNMIVSGFPGIEEAKARIEPFWKSTFPTNPSSINIILTDPSTP